MKSTKFRVVLSFFAFTIGFIGIFLLFVDSFGSEDYSIGRIRGVQTVDLVENSPLNLTKFITTKNYQENSYWIDSISADILQNDDSYYISYIHDRNLNFIKNQINGIHNSEIFFETTEYGNFIHTFPTGDLYILRYDEITSESRLLIYSPTSNRETLIRIPIENRIQDVFFDTNKYIFYFTTVSSDGLFTIHTLLNNNQLLNIFSDSGIGSTMKIFSIDNSSNIIYLTDQTNCFEVKLESKTRNQIDCQEMYVLNDTPFILRKNSEVFFLQDGSNYKVADNFETNLVQQNFFLTSDRLYFIEFSIESIEDKMLKYLDLVEGNIVEVDIDIPKVFVKDFFIIGGVFHILSHKDILYKNPEETNINSPMSYPISYSFNPAQGWENLKLPEDISSLQIFLPRSSLPVYRLL